MRTNTFLIYLFLFTLFSDDMLFAQQEVSIPNTSRGTCKVFFVDDIFDTNAEIITVTSAQFAAINDEIEVICDADTSCTGDKDNGACILVFDPVCGCNREFYSNSCFANLDGIYTYWYSNDQSCSIPSGVVGNPKRRKRTKGRKSQIQGETPGLSSCTVDYNWEWTIIDYDDETFEILSQTTIVKKFRVIDTEAPTIYLLPDANGEIPLELIEDNTSAALTNTILYSNGMIQWEATDDCGNVGITTLNPSSGSKQNWYADFDNDGYGDPNTILRWGGQPPNYVNNALDCDDTNFLVNPEGEEIPGNTIDENCDGDYGKINCFWDVQRVSDVQLKGNFSAEYLLESDAKLLTGANVVFQSTETITLMPGFTAQAGSNFTAQINPCEEGDIIFLDKSEERATEEKIEKVTTFALKASPNPIQQGNPLRIDFTLSDTEKVNIVLYNAFGIDLKEVVQSSVFAAGEHHIMVPTNDLANGIYILQLQSEENKVVQKIIIQNGN